MCGGCRKCQPAESGRSEDVRFERELADPTRTAAHATADLQTTEASMIWVDKLCPAVVPAVIPPAVRLAPPVDRSCRAVRNSLPRMQMEVQYQTKTKQQGGCVREVLVCSIVVFWIVAGSIVVCSIEDGVHRGHAHRRRGLHGGGARRPR